MKKKIIAGLTITLALLALTVLYLAPGLLRWKIERILIQHFPYQEVRVDRCEWRPHWTLAIDRIVAGKLQLSELQATVGISHGTLRLDPVQFRLLDHPIHGFCEISFAEQPITHLHLSMEALPIELVLKTMAWDKKCLVSGLLSGAIDLGLTGEQLTALDGRLTTLTPGGTITILDQEFLQRLATQAKQPIEIVKASFEKYNYNTGSVGLSLAEKSIRLKLQLEGEQGKRDLEVTLHDFL